MKRVLRTTVIFMLAMIMMVCMMVPAAFAAGNTISVPVVVTMNVKPENGSLPASDQIPVTVTALTGGAPAFSAPAAVECDGDVGYGEIDITFGPCEDRGVYEYGVTIGKSALVDFVIDDKYEHYVIVLYVVNNDDLSALENYMAIYPAEYVNGTYVYDNTVEEKPDALTASKTYAAPLTITLSKRWPDGGKQPVTFYLYEVIENPTEDLNADGEIDEKDARKKVNEVVLSTDNNWQHKFKTTSDGKLLDSRKEYVLDEKNVPGYHESYHYNKDDALNWIVSVVNRKSLYQTGQLNWPIPVLACCGSMFMIAGAFMLRKKEEHTNG